MRMVSRHEELSRHEEIATHIPQNISFSLPLTICHPTSRLNRQLMGGHLWPYSWPQVLPPPHNPRVTYLTQQPPPPPFTAAASEEPYNSLSLSSATPLRYDPIQQRRRAEVVRLANQSVNQSVSQSAVRPRKSGPLACKSPRISAMLRRRDGMKKGVGW